MGIVGNGGESRDTRIREEWETTEVEKERTAQDTEKKTKQIQNNLHNIKTYIQRDTYFFLLLARVFFFVSCIAMRSNENERWQDKGDRNKETMLVEKCC